MGTIAGSGAGGGNPQPLLIAANRGYIPQATTTAAANSLRAESRKLFTLGGTDYSELRIAYAGFYVTATNVETAPGNDQSIQAAIEITGAPTPVVQATWGASQTGNIVNGAAIYISDALYPSQFGLTKFAKNTQFYVREVRAVTSGQMFTREGAIANMTGEGTAFSNGLSASQLLSTGPLVAPSGGSLITRDMGATGVIGRPIGHEIAVVAIGNSILAGFDDINAPTGDDGTAGGGFLQRGLHNTSGRSIPLVQMSYAGTRASQFVASMAKRQAWFPYCTIGVEEYGTNDFADGARTVAQIYSDRQTIWATMRAGGVRHIEAVPIFPRTTSTDNFLTTANQTPNAGYATGGTFRDPMNADLATALGLGLIDGIINTNSIAADSILVDRWVVDGVTANYPTPDGTHPQPVLAPLMAAVVSARAATWF